MPHHHGWINLNHAKFFFLERSRRTLLIIEAARERERENGVKLVRDEDFSFNCLIVKKCSSRRYIDGYTGSTVLSPTASAGGFQVNA